MLRHDPLADVRFLGIEPDDAEMSPSNVEDVKRRFGVAFGLVLALAVGSAATLDAGVRPQATPAAGRVIDRTFRCTPGTLYGGVRQFDVTAKPRGSLGNGGRSDDVSPGYVSVGSGLASGTFDDLVFARSRLEERRAAPSGSWPAGVYADMRRCRAVRVSVPLSAKGLPGPPVRFEQDADCDVRGRVLVRLRAVLEAPAPWRSATPPYAVARRNVVQVKIAVRSERTRRPIGLLALDPAGGTRLWVSGGCS
jgi:hypothetical protein